MAYGNQRGSGSGRGKKFDRPLTYHGPLAKGGPVRLTVDEEPFFLTKKNNHTVKLTLHSEGAEVPITYWCESAACAEFFKGKKGQTMTVTFEGREDDATIVQQGVHDAPPDDPHPSPPQTQRPPATQTQTRPAPAAAPGSVAPSEEVWVKKCKVFVARRVSLRKVCVVAVAKFVQEAKALGYPEPSPDQFWAIVNSAYMSAEAEGLAMRAGFADALPVNLDFKTLAPVHSKAPPQEKKKEPPPPTTAPCRGCNAEVEKVQLDADGFCQACANDDVPF